jgi:hypothetical protein
MSGGTYAAKTEVPVTRSRDEIERTLTRFGASKFAYFNDPPHVAVAFEIKGLRVMMRMEMPDRERFATDSRGKRRVDSAIDRDHEQACRQRWRTLANAIKAKLAMVDDGISTVEREFLSDVMLPNGQTIGDRIAPDIRAVVESGDIPPLMPGKPERKVVALGEGR